MSELHDVSGTFKTIEWTEQGVRILDQRLLPGQEIYRTYTSYSDVAEAIRAMVIRGAPAIGVAAAMGVALGIKHSRAPDASGLRVEFDKIAATLGATRPTAVNLAWALARMRATFEHSLAVELPENAASPSFGTRPPSSKPGPPEITPPLVARVAQSLADEAQEILAEDVRNNEELGRHGAALMPEAGTILTHCNAGALATGGYGTALGVIRAAVAAGKRLAVFAGETRPFLQGARLTAWELAKYRIPVTIITDNMGGHFMQRGQIQAVIVGADRIAANGDTANKIGTYSLAVLAHENAVPFYVAAPRSSIDLSLVSGEYIPIEQRSAAEVTHLAGVDLAPAGVTALHPAFDVTPARYITAIVTERGVARPPFAASLRALCASPTNP